jgi:hypothetical protein
MWKGDAIATQWRPLLEADHIGREECPKTTACGLADGETLPPNQEMKRR